MGKSKLIEMLGRLVDGTFSVSQNESAADIKKRLLTPDAASKRIVAIDNVKTNRLSWAELESMITSPEVSGHRMYSGEATRPNTLLWTLTLNGPAMSRDMAQRSVIMTLGVPRLSMSPSLTHVGSYSVIVASATSA